MDPIKELESKKRIRGYNFESFGSFEIWCDEVEPLLHFSKNYAQKFSSAKAAALCMHSLGQDLDTKNHINDAIGIVNQAIIFGKKYKSESNIQQKIETAPRYVQQNTTYNVTGPNARVNNQSVDNSTNMNVQSSTELESLLAQLRNEIRSQHVEPSVIDDALDVVEVIEIQSKKEKPNKTILSSLLDGLTRLLPHAGNLASIGSMILAATSN